MKLRLIKITTVLFLVYSSLLAQDSRLPGDLNGDSRMDVLDLLTLLTAMQPGATVAADTDLDRSGATDMDDVLILLCLLRDETSQENIFEYALVINSIRVLENSNVWSVQSSGTDEPQNLLRYTISASRELDNFSLTFNGTVISDSLQGHLPKTFSKDTLVVKLWDYVSQKRFDFDFFVDKVPWLLELEDMEGNIIKGSGFVKVNIDFDVIVDGGPNFFGKEIQFPVVLNGPDQRFTYSSQNIIVDLNPEKQSNVIFHDIVSLCGAINRNSSNLYQSVAPAYNYAEKKQVNIIEIHIRDWGWPSPPEPLDGNTVLLDKIGFPEWIRKLPPHDMGYWFNWSGND